MANSPQGPLTRPKSHSINRRTALIGAGAGVAAALGIQTALQQVPDANYAQLPTSPPEEQSTTPQQIPNANYAQLPTSTPDGRATTHDIILTASEFDWELMPGTMIRAWGYNGQVPGPEIRVREGDLVRVRLHNDLPVATTIHWHGVTTTPAMDGPAGLNQAAVEPGEEFQYEFIAKPGGTRWYHSHADPALQIPMGLYGPLIVEPRQASAVYDREYTLILQECDLELTPDVAAGTATRGPRDKMERGSELGTDLFLVNGHMHGAIPPVRLASGERILLRVINAGHISHPVHTHGHSFRIVATDGNAVPEVAQLTKDTVLVGPGERYDLEILGDNPGVWMLHCHIEHHMANGMMTTLWYDGHEPSGPVKDFFEGMGDMMDMQHMHEMPQTPVPTAIPATEDAGGDPGSAVEIDMVDDRFVPQTLTVPAGTTITWVNTGSDWHSVASYDGSFESEKIPPGESFSIVLPNPGDYQYICKHHGLQGMLGTIHVELIPP